MANSAGLTVRQHSMKTTTKKPTTAGHTKRLVCDGLVSGLEALTKPDYHELNRKKQRLLHACLCAYAKHYLDRDEIGWNELSEILWAAICEEIGDEQFCAWLMVVGKDAEPHVATDPRPGFFPANDQAHA